MSVYWSGGGTLASKRMSRNRDNGVWRGRKKERHVKENKLNKNYRTSFEMLNVERK